MNTKLVFLTLLTLLFAVNPIAAQSSKSNRTTIIFNVPMDCHLCQQKIEKNIAFERGVKAMKVLLEKQTVEITFDVRRTNVEKLQQAFKKIGYEASLSKQEKNVAKPAY